MAVGLLFVFVAPLLIGALLIAILRERTIGFIGRYACGLLSLFVLFFVLLLFALKFDLLLMKLEKGYFISAFVLSILGIPFFVKQVKTVKFAKFKPSSLWVIVPAALLAIYSYVYLAPSFANEDIWEIVSTTLAHSSIYEYSAMTGKQMINGLPIFNKIYMLPVFFSAYCDSFKTSMWIIGGVVFPIMLFVVNLNIVYEIGIESKVSEVKRYMLMYMVLLIGGTYLPSKGIPVTIGFALLREGYSGYAVAYGLIIPLTVLMLIKRRYILAIFSFFSVIPFVRIDRIFYAILNPIKAYRDINSAGKLLGLYIISGVIYISLCLIKKDEIRISLLLCPEVFISYGIVYFSNMIERKKKNVFFASLGLIGLSICSFQPFFESERLIDVIRYEREVKKIVQSLDLQGKIVWGSEDFMATVRRVDGKVCTLYGRDDVSSILDGVDYEDNSEYVWDYYYSYKNMHAAKPMFYPSTLTIEEAIEKAYEEGMDILIE